VRASVGSAEGFAEGSKGNDVGNSVGDSVSSRLGARMLGAGVVGTVVGVAVAPIEDCDLLCLLLFADFSVGDEVGDCEGDELCLEGRMLGDIEDVGDPVGA